jgi:hypothetical protein
MRISTPIRILLLLLALASPALLRAQFQQPTAEELAMTSDPKAPGAAAVYLNIEEITDDPHHFYSFYTRIKILQETGKNLANVEIPFQVGDTGSTGAKPRVIGQDWLTNSDSGEKGAKPSGKTPNPQEIFKIDEIKGRTIHPDGTVIPLNVRPDELLKLKSPDGQFDRMAFTMPGVEVGSILEYRYTIRYDEKHFSSPFWQVQRSFYVRKSHYAFTPFNDFLNDDQAMTSRYLLDARGKVVNTLIWWPVLPPGVTVKRDAIGNFSLDLTDTPPAPNEEWMPPVQSLAYHVFFYYKNAFSGSEFWTSENKRWSKDVDRFAEPTAAIRQAVAGLVAPGDSDIDKARKLYKAVQALGSSSARSARSAEEAWSSKSGTSEGTALLYLAMLRAAGLTAYAMAVVDRDKGIFSSGYLSFDQFDSYIVILSLGGNEIFLDPGEKMCPFQTMHWRHSGATGIRQSAGAPVVARTPFQAYTANSLLRTGDVTVDDHGAVTGRINFIMSGQEAIRWRQIALGNDETEVKKQFDRSLESVVPNGIEAHIDHFLSLGDPDANLIAIVNVHGTLGAATSGRLQLPAFFFETRGAHPFVDQGKRIEPVDMHYGEQVTDQIVYHLPAGLSVEGAPQDTKVSWEGHAVLGTKVAAAPGQITIVRSLARAFTFAKPEEYQDLRGFYQKVAAADQQQLVLTRTAVAQGN